MIAFALPMERDRRPRAFTPAGGGNPYEDHTHQQVLEMHLQGLDLDTPDLNALRAEWKFPALVTCNRWIDIFYETGDICPKRATGNAYSQREILGDVLEKLALYRSVFVKATAAECRAYLYNLDPTVDPYSHSQLCRAEDLLGLKRKAASTTADLAYTTSNLQKRNFYWSHPPPLGMQGISTADIIDIDEAGFKLEHQNRKFGKTVSALRCTQAGVYGRGEKLNLLLAISGDDVNVMRWHEIWMMGGTTITRFYDFIRRILDDLAVQFPGRRFCFTMDNLNSHKNPIILNMLHNAGHLYVFRAPYWPTDGAVEYVFNTVQTRLKVHLNKLTTMEELRNRVNLIVGTIPSFYRYFLHVGFPP
jgi:hypothetical protein